MKAGVKRLLLVVLGVGVLATGLGVSSAVTAHGPTPVTCGTTITQPGTYVLAGDCAASGDGILILASKVNLRLNGHTMTGAGRDFFGVGIFSSSKVLVTGPGTISGFASGVTLGNVSDSMVKKVTATGNTLFGIVVENGGSGNTIKKNTALNSGDTDVLDTGFGCPEARWRNNVFGTASQPCIH